MLFPRKPNHYFKAVFLCYIQDIGWRYSISTYTINSITCHHFEIGPYYSRFRVLEIMFVRLERAVRNAFNVELILTAIQELSLNKYTLTHTLYFFLFQIDQLTLC